MNISKKLKILIIMIKIIHTAKSQFLIKFPHYCLFIYTTLLDYGSPTLFNFF